MASLNDALLTATKASKEANQTRQQYYASRANAKTIISPDEVAGDYDFNRLLVTTLGGETRAITREDLRTFQAFASQLGSKYKGGIKIKQVIDLSLAADRERANKQIHTAMPVSNKGGLIHFQTNASAESEAKRHHVHVQLLNWDAIVASPMHPDKAVKELLKSPIKIECDCGRWRYFFRYVANAGKYALVRETGFPKIRNPQLKGVACKHILRVMQVMANSPTYRMMLQKQIEQARQQLENKRMAVTAKEMREMQEKMRKEYGKKKITTLDERRAARQAKPVNDLKAKAQEKAKAKAAQKATKAKQAAFNEAELSLKNLLKLGGINQQQYETMLNTLRNSK